MPTKAEQKWMDQITGIVGCIVCRSEGYGYVPAEVHHLKRGQYRIGHLHSIPLCSDHHGPDSNLEYGHARHNGAKLFAIRYGDDFHLLEKTKLTLSVLGGRIYGKR